MPYTAHGEPGSDVCVAVLTDGSALWCCTGTRGHADDHAAYGSDTANPIKTWPVEQSDAQVVDEIVGQLEQAQNERDDAQAALDLAATRWNNVRGYVAELLGQARDQLDHSRGTLGDAYPFESGAYEAEVRVLEAVASFMDGQHDGSVTRG